MTITPTTGAPGSHAAQPAPDTRSTRSVTGIGAGTAVLTTAALLWANYVTTPWKDSAQDWGIDNDLGFAGLLLIAGFVALAVGVVFGVLVRHALAAEPASAARTAMILAVVALPLVVVAFWTGLPFVLGTAALWLGLDARARLGSTPTTAAVALGLGPLVALAALFFCVTG